ncbi:MAG: dihydrolipoyl dehydrogenase [Alphaproteobacteria bacterium RIFCSPLOWO2_01_FULL_45_8]|nr:MAG: dihydrolipoyl dehydrogenase [Alphaproteobacteria bacterium RIFCSPLOWO2_01_FULL_45_8]
MSQSYNLIVIGGGPGGYVAAIRAAQLGLKTAVVEQEKLGGVCLNWGCIPTKALLRSAEIYHLMHRLDEFGLSASSIKFDIKKIVDRSRKVSQQLSTGISHLMKKNKVTVITGHGKLLGQNRVKVTHGKETQVLTAPHIILATGARPRLFPGLEADGQLIWTSKEAMVPEKMPKSLLIIGSGAIGVEFASFYATLGSEVTLVEIQDRILPVEDAEISAVAHKDFTKQGIKIHTSTNVKSLEKEKNAVKVTLNHKDRSSTLTVDRVIVATGIVGNTENLGLEKTRIKVENNQIKTNEWCLTDEPGVYAIGDVAGAPWLAHKASHEAIICVEKIANSPTAHPLNKLNIPGCTYSLPQIASVGLTEAAALHKGYKIRVGRFPYRGNGKAVALGEAEGLIKTIFDEKTGELLGAHMIGSEVTELIQGYVIGKTLETTELDLINTVFPHPTLSEMMHEAVLDAYGKAIHF